jgi:hypothetical protein
LWLSRFDCGLWLSRFERFEPVGPELWLSRFPDVCGRGSAGIYCAPSTGGSFNPLTLWIANFSDAFGWSSQPYYSTIRFPQ